jgi:hypothetical protein
MAILKQGAKGKDVEKLQNDLNKLGAKPKLKVDGIFGPITKKAVQDFQKKAKLKPDGSVGALTSASILMGGPLPEMTVEDARDMQKMAKAQMKTNHSYVKLMDDIMVEGIMLRKAVEGHRDIGKKAVETNKSLWSELFSVLDSLNKKQAQFDSLLLIAPKTAAKLVPQCEDLAAEAERIADVIMVTYVEIGKDVDTVVSAVADHAKRISDNASKLSKLTGHPLK